MDAALALDRLKHDSCGPAATTASSASMSLERDVRRLERQRGKRIPVLRLGGRERAEGPPMVAALGPTIFLRPVGDDRELERGLDRFRAGVREEVAVSPSGIAVESARNAAARWSLKKLWQEISRAIWSCIMA